MNTCTIVLADSGKIWLLEHQGKGWCPKVRGPYTSETAVALMAREQLVSVKPSRRAKVALLEARAITESELASIALHNRPLS